MIKNDLISILIPAYNTEKYIDMCLQSVVAQSYKNLEIIIINDGSTDRTKDIIKSYFMIDDRVRYYSQKNQGYGPTCQNMLTRANGKYVAFIDSDDIIDECYIEKLYSAIKQSNSDVSACKICRLNHNAKIKKHRIGRELCITDRKGALRELIYMRKTSTGLACKLFKRNLFNNFIFPISNYSNDYYSAWHVFNNAFRFVFIDYYGYYYVYNQNSVTKRRVFSNDRLLSIKYAEDNARYVQYKYPKLIKACRNRIVIEAIVILRQIDREQNPWIYEECKKRIFAGRLSMIFDPFIRFRTKLILLLSYLIKFRYIYKKFK